MRLRIDVLAAREEHIRESWVKAMEARLVREELQKCHKFEGVNHYQSCKELAERYIDLLKDAKVRTMRYVISQVVSFRAHPIIG